MKRSPMKPREKPFGRKAGVNPINRKRKAKRYAETFGDKVTWIRQMSCCVCGRAGPSAPHHVKSRGAGGTAADMAPLCDRHHLEIHATGVDTFAAKYAVDLPSLAARYETWWQEGERTGLHPLGF